MDAEYVFRVRVRLDPADEGVRVDPATFETTLYRRAEPPGEDGWLFFRDNLWRGEVNDEGHLRDLAEDSLGVLVDSVSFSALRTDEEYLDAVKAEIGDSLAPFNADTVPEVVSKYLGSSVEVRDPDS
jgi:hypothetical protein